MTIRTALLACLLLPALAQAEQANPSTQDRGERLARADRNGDGQLDRSEAEALGPRLAEHFDRVDGDRNGQLSREELRSAHHRRMAMRGGMRGRAMGRMAYMRGLFAGIDDNGDRAITRQEIGERFERLRENFDSMDADRNGALTGEEMRQWHRAQRQQRREQHGEHDRRHD
jgi:Ca2+-binding EF-hand superfamily protein